MDRDGVINKDRPDYVKSWSEFEFLPGSLDALKLLTLNGYRIILVTNQSVINRGMVTEAGLQSIHQKMTIELAKYGAHVDAIYYCPHHPDDGCECRKPRPGLAYRAIRALNIEPEQSFFIGDRLMDVIVARHIGCKSIMVPYAVGQEEIKNGSVYPDYIAPSFELAAKWVIRQKTNTYLEGSQE